MIALAFTMLSAMLLHPAQESLAELQYNEETQRVEVALRLSLADEQQFLTSASKSPIEDLIASPAELEKAALGVLRTRLRFGTRDEVTATKAASESAKAYHWVGRESEGGHVWWYFAYAGTPKQITHLRCTLFKAPGHARHPSRSATAHDHLHAMPVSTFLVMQPNQAGEPNSFTTTREKPVHRIEW
ncbi:DUF6702 family protein [Allorhodopirellula solitaria]|uniref:Uncharacterized protein n=1 Tax=Allorhodopirellula solitaria TaxID=2527987 RepID=A0A5C5YBL2_9BACT|nr:DUF6702 family protein [Allorhodopirellula solitaria]TWT73086.1 hypothetical protein CA85_15520 [Allorhodopirellula solitaria]